VLLYDTTLFFLSRFGAYVRYDFIYSRLVLALMPSTGRDNGFGGETVEKRLENAHDR
jgi:hypothetical protein